jgi:lipid-A-disaccharide synthase
VTAPLFTAAEVSGDRLGGSVLSALAALRPDLRWRGVGGPAMAASGVFDAFGDVDRLGGAGLVELLPRLPALAAARRTLLAAIADAPPLAVFVDAPDLHLALARRSRRLGVPTALLVVPQFWAWRPGRRQEVAAAATLALCLFRHEVAPLRRLGVAAFWVGHPAADLEPVPPGARRSPRLALLPGSRRSEIARHLRPFVAAARALGCTDVEVAWRPVDAPPSMDGVRFTRDSGPSLLARADVALVAPGTATLEAALLGVPTVVAGGLHPVSARVARRLLRVPTVALPNLLLGREVLPEVLQDLHVERLTAALGPLFADLASARERALALADELRPAVGSPGFGARAAARLLPLLEAA